MIIEQVVLCSITTWHRAPASCLWDATGCITIYDTFVLDSELSHTHLLMLHSMSHTSAVKHNLQIPLEKNKLNVVIIRAKSDDSLFCSPKPTGFEVFLFVLSPEVDF